MYQAGAVIEKHGYLFMVCRSFEPPLLKTIPYMVKLPFCIFSKLPIYLEILSKSNT